MKIRIKNFRSLKDTKFIDIKPITVLVGKNSSGKSTFLRTFPMFKQSVEERTKTPILLYGNYVDFGSYKDIRPYFVMNTDNKENDVEFSFSIEKKDLRTILNRFRHSYDSVDKYFEDITYSIKFEEDKKQLLHIFEMNIKLLNDSLKIIFDTSKSQVKQMFINKEELTSSSDNFQYFERGELVPNLYYHTRSGIENISHLFRSQILNLISHIVHGRTESNTKQKIFDRMIFGNDHDFLENLKSIKMLESWSATIDSWTIETKDFLNLKKAFFLYTIFIKYLPAINNYLSSTFTNVRYIAPLRATAERYYRIQHLSVDEVDQNGKNLPFFLDSLTETQLESFQDWTSELFNFKTKIKKIEGHYSIKIVHQDDFEINLSDTGFGYSQILPILTQLWYSSSRFDKKRNVILRNRNVEKIIVIEQPELHLHPEFQAKFADSIAKVIRNRGNNRKNQLKIIIETHSDIIVNRLGDCIIDKILDPADVNIVVFNKKQENAPTEISFSQYDKNGYLLNWPLGFFQPKL
jgi:predicted ATPase